MKIIIYLLFIILGIIIYLTLNRIDKFNIGSGFVARKEEEEGKWTITSYNISDEQWEAQQDWIRSNMSDVIINVSGTRHVVGTEYYFNDKDIDGINILFGYLKQGWYTIDDEYDNVLFDYYSPNIHSTDTYEARPGSTHYSMLSWEEKQKNKGLILTYFKRLRFEDKDTETRETEEAKIDKAFYFVATDRPFRTRVDFILGLYEVPLEEIQWKFGNIRYIEVPIWRDINYYLTNGPGIRIFINIIVKYQDTQESFFMHANLKLNSKLDSKGLYGLSFYVSPGWQIIFSHSPPQREAEINNLLQYILTVQYDPAEDVIQQFKSPSLESIIYTQLPPPLHGVVRRSDGIDQKWIYKFEYETLQGFRQIYTDEGQQHGYKYNIGDFLKFNNIGIKILQHIAKEISDNFELIFGFDPNNIRILLNQGQGRFLLGEEYQTLTYIPDMYKIQTLKLSPNRVSLPHNQGEFFTGGTILKDYYSHEYKLLGLFKSYPRRARLELPASQGGQGPMYPLDFYFNKHYEVFIPYFLKFMREDPHVQEAFRYAKDSGVSVQDLKCEQLIAQFFSSEYLDVILVEFEDKIAEIESISDDDFLGSQFGFQGNLKTKLDGAGIFGLKDPKPYTFRLTKETEGRVPPSYYLQCFEYQRTGVVNDTTKLVRSIDLEHGLEIIELSIYPIEEEPNITLKEFGGETYELLHEAPWRPSFNRNTKIIYLRDWYEKILSIVYPYEIRYAILKAKDLRELSVCAADPLEEGWASSRRSGER